MSRTKADCSSVDVSRLLAGAARTVQKVPYCWLVTMPETGGSRARPMGRLLHDPGEDEWTIRFVTDGRSDKVSDLRRGGMVTLIFQGDPSEAYAALIGAATLRAEAAEVRRRWKAHYDAYFPTELDRANAVFVEVVVERMELWIRGVTPEPFGFQTTSLERSAGRAWQLARRDREAA
jgi:general stress protein 26